MPDDNPPWVSHTAANRLKDEPHEFTTANKPIPVSIRLDMQPRTPEHGQPYETWVNGTAAAWTRDAVRVHHDSGLTYVPDVWVGAGDVRRR